MRRDHHHSQQHLHQDPLLGHLTAEYGDRVATGLIEARVATLCSDAPHGQDRLSAEHLACSEVASLAAAPQSRQRDRR